MLMHMKPSWQSALTTAEENWNKAVQHMKHLTAPIYELLDARAEMRQGIINSVKESSAAAKTSWRICVVAGPSGRGKTTFISDVLGKFQYQGK